MNILLMILIIATALEIIMFIMMMYMLHNDVVKLKEEQTNFNKQITEILNDYHNYTKEYDGIRNNTCKDILTVDQALLDQYKIINENYQLFETAYNVMEERITKLGDHYSKLMSSLSAIEDRYTAIRVGSVKIDNRYSDIYELISDLRTRFDRIEKALEGQTVKVTLPYVINRNAGEIYGENNESSIDNDICDT